MNSLFSPALTPRHSAAGLIALNSIPRACILTDALSHRGFVYTTLRGLAFVKLRVIRRSIDRTFLSWVENCYCGASVSGFFAFLWARALCSFNLRDLFYSFNSIGPKMYRANTPRTILKINQQNEILIIFNSVLKCHPLHLQWSFDVLPYIDFQDH